MANKPHEVRLGPTKKSGYSRGSVIPLEQSSKRVIQLVPGSIKHKSGNRGLTLALEVLDAVTMKSERKINLSEEGTSKLLDALQLLADMRQGPPEQVGVLLPVSEVSAGLVPTDVSSVLSTIIDKKMSLQVIEGILDAGLTTAEVITAAERRKALIVFEGLLTDPTFFMENMKAWSCNGPEDVWQKFFERNKWILGYGLQYQFGKPLDGRTLEQVVRGANLEGGGKRVDGLLKTLGIINNLCFVEVKTHETALLGSMYGGRSDIYPPSSALAGAAAQVQVTVQKTIEEVRAKIEPVDREGFVSGEELYAICPRAMVICGTLDEFMRDGKHNIAKVRSFELYRRNLRSPEVITFDELYERTKYIVADGPST